MTTTCWTTMTSPVGELVLVSDGGALREVCFADKSTPEVLDAERRGTDATVVCAQAQLDEYFAGRRVTFDLPIAPRGTTFQLRVWEMLRGVPYGKTISYAQLARLVGNPNASRAVGMANSRNPLPIIVPCHRVIGSNGTLTGYAGGLDRKRSLLDLEAAVRAG